LIDDFIGKRLGRGDAFYGERLSDLSDEEYRQKLAPKLEADLKIKELLPTPVRGMTGASRRAAALEGCGF
jgi:hypothetical protein